MPTYICSFEREGVRYYFDFSSVVDAPTTCALKRREYERHYFRKYGTEGMRDLPARLKRATEKGTSAHGDPDLKATVWLNRAGPKERRISVKKLLDLVLTERKNWLERCAEEGEPKEPTI